MPVIPRLSTFLRDDNGVIRDNLSGFAAGTNVPKNSESAFSFFYGKQSSYINSKKIVLIFFLQFSRC